LPSFANSIRPRFRRRRSTKPRAASWTWSAWPTSGPARRWRPSTEIAAILGYVDEPELIYRETLVLLG
jgi:hypothetical protein